MKSAIWLDVTISIAIIHQVITGGTDKNRLRHQSPPQHSEVKQDRNTTIVTKPSSNSATVAIQEEATSHELVPTQEQEQQHLPPIDEKSRDEILHILTNPGNNPEAAIIQEEEASHNEIPTQLLHPLSIDENSTIASDIVNIWHDTDSKEICVALTQDARCPRPALHGRLSGPSLATLDWKEPATTSNIGADVNGTVLCGGYGHNWLMREITLSKS